MERPATYYLAKFVADTQYDGIPRKVIKEAKVCLLDTIGCMLSGASLKEVKKLMELDQAIGGKPESTIIYHGIKVPSIAAARINAYMGDIMELNDLIGGHASIGNIPACLAVAEAKSASGRDLLTAIVVGIETTAKIYNSYYSYLKPYIDCGMVPVGFPSTVGIAAATSKLLNLSLNHTQNALAIAASLAGWCPAEVIFGDGGSVKPLLFGAWPAAVGIYAAGCAQNGMTGPPLILESEKGYLRTVARNFDISKITEETWALEKPARKAHACCGYTHSALDAIILLMKRNRVSPQDLESIHVEVPEYTYPAIFKPDRPDSPDKARFHLPYCAAVVANNLSFFSARDAFEFKRNLADPLIDELFDKVKLVPDKALAHYHQSKVTLTVRDGREFSLYNEFPKGSYENPLSEEELLAKFDGLASSVYGNERSELIKNEIFQIERARDISELISLLVG